ncbi:MAG TPA: hypothetical protein VE959_23130 [Bryobacteraceae bacterium]|nr:hypothetical protein [Bryobacteraceae bacterium]
MKILLLAATFGCAWAQTPDIGQIMSRVALNQAKSQDLRKFYVYNQKQLLKMVRGNGKVAREEHREYAISPKERGIKKDLTRFDGTYEAHGRYTAYDKPGYSYKGIDIDGQVLDGMSNDMTDDQESRDGIGHDLFPLTYHQQLKYNFQFMGTETFRGRPVYRVSFVPKPHQEEEAAWKGEALIDTEEFQPVQVSTRLAFNIPLAVKVLLGTNIKGLGFAVTYQKFADGLWFPVSYGGEFDVRAVFFYKRVISISLVNSDFRKMDVTSNIAYNTEDK